MSDELSDAKKARLLEMCADAHDAVFGPNHCRAPRDLRAQAKKLAAGGGPGQVASDAYRAGYDAIFGARLPVPEA
jgi:hypothetical protein